jgi:Asp-tRNA(Asn)/Glu-tRNA(Gln) amidotransferase A subunit family amidase
MPGPIFRINYAKQYWSLAVPPSTPSDLNLLTATEASRRMAAGDLTSEALTKACIARITAREPEVKAFAYFDADQALEQARAMDRARASGKLTGPLVGLPVAVKDIIDTADMPTENGSAIFKGRQPPDDAACVAALRQAGCVIIGKTVTTELATLTPGKTHNPANLGHTPGGSSSGSAAGVADGMFPLALATQTGGSVIRPASFCGIYALKPTFGMISRVGVTMQSHTLDTIGVYGRSVADLALLADALSAYDARDAQSYYPRTATNMVRIAAEKPPVTPLFCFVKTPAWEVADPIAKEAIAELIAELGDRVEEMEMPSLVTTAAHAATVGGAENAAYYGGIADAAGDAMSKGLRERIEKGRKISAEAYIKALNARERAAPAIDNQLSLSHTAIITLAAPGPAPKTLGSTGNPAFNAPWTYLGHPCVTLPLLEVDGMPLGVQLIGARRDDARLLRTAQWLVDKLAAV